MMRHHSTRHLRWLIAALSCFGVMPVWAQGSADEEIVVPDNFAEALISGQTVLTLRYRFETVDQDGFRDTAEASTLRSTLSYSTAPYKGLRFFFEVENVAAIGDDDNYNNAGAGSLNNGVRDRPVVADPALTEVNQGYLELAVQKLLLRFGRREIALDNQRFVGPVGWRQHHQSFDSISLESRDLDRVKLGYHYLNKAHRIFGDSLEMSSHLLNASFEISDKDKLTGYGYLLDYDDPAFAVASTLTYGLRWTGHKMFDRAKFSYTLEAAVQEDAGDNPRTIDADYYHLDLAAGTKAFTVRVGGESLSGSLEDGAFSTPLATLHKFNGWADKFLRTPTNGLVDLYAGVEGGTKKLRLKAVYHDFQPEDSGDDYGTELNLQALYKSTNGLSFGLKAAFYDADTFATDTDKIWFWTAYRLSTK